MVWMKLHKEDAARALAGLSVPSDREVLMTKIEKILKTVKHNQQYRDKTKKVRFNLQWSFLLGEGTTSALGAKSFETPHNFKQGRARGN